MFDPPHGAVCGGLNRLPKIAKDAGSRTGVVVKRSTSLEPISLVIVLSAANVHDSVLLEDLIDRIPPLRKPPPPTPGQSARSDG